MNWKGIMPDSSGTAFIPVRVVISIAVGAAIIGLVFLGLQFADETTAQEKVQRACDSLEASLTTTIQGDARDVDNPPDSPGSTYHWSPTLPSELSYLGLGVDPDPDNDGTLQGGITDTGNCIYYKTEGGDKQAIWLDENIQFRTGSLNDGRWTIEQPDGYVIQGGGTVNLTFEAVEKQSQRYILIRADDGVPYIDRIPPDVNITAPATECYLDGPLTVNWTANDDYADISIVDISYRPVDSPSWTSIASDVENNGTYKVTNLFPDSGRYHVRVSAHDGRNTGSDVSEPISYQFPYTTLNAEPCYRGEDAWWITPSSNLSFLTHYAANTYHRIWDEETGWDSWKTGNPILSSRGKYYIEFYSTGNGLNESSPNWEYVNNQTIYVDDSPPSSHVEIEGPKTTEMETIHKPIDVVFLIDTSGSMPSEWRGLCDTIGDITSGVENVGVDFRYDIYGLGEGDPDDHPDNRHYWDVDDDYTACASDNWIRGYYQGAQILLTSEKIDLYGVHGTMESWGPGTAGVARFYNWREGVVKVIVPMADEGAFWGNGPCDGERDQKSITDAITECNKNNIIVFPVSGENCKECVKESMERLAQETQGERYDWHSKTQIKDQLIETIGEVTQTEAIAGSATSSTTIRLKIERNQYEIPSTRIHYKIQHPETETEWMAGNPDKDIPIRIFAEGSHTISFYAEDQLGRTEERKEKTYYVDGTAPASMVSPKTAELDEGNSLQIEVTEAEDPNDGIGIKEVELYYKVGSEDWQYYETTGEEPYTWEFTAPETGTYQFKTVAVDMVGNREEK